MNSAAPDAWTASKSAGNAKTAASITVRISGRAVAGGDEPSDVLEAIAEDITERRVLEDQFRQAQKMEAVGRLAGGIAHDFNNLLMVISGYTEVLLDQLTLGHPLHPKPKPFSRPPTAPQRLTRQLLAFSRKQLLELKVIDVNAIVADMERLLRPLIGEDIELTTSLAPNVGCTRADAGQLEQVIMNLVVNAKDAMPGGGKICIRTASVTLDDSYRPENTFIKNGPYVMISVSDTGQGMDRETQARIFEPFFTTKEKGKGTGLGLSTVYGIIKQSGGYVFVQSESAAAPSSPFISRASTNPPKPSAPLPFPRRRRRIRNRPPSRGRRFRPPASPRNPRIPRLPRPRSRQRQRRPSPRRRSRRPHPLSHHRRYHARPKRPRTSPATPPRAPRLKVLYLSGYAQDAFPAPAAADSQKTFLQKPFTLQSLSRKVREILGPPTN